MLEKTGLLPLRVLSLMHPLKFISRIEDTLRASDSTALSAYLEKSSTDEMDLSMMDFLQEIVGAVELKVQRKEDTAVFISIVPPLAVLSDIQPGNYEISTSTGRLLWNGELSAQDVLWGKANPGTAFAMAADIGKSADNPTREIILLENELVLSVYAGFSGGRLHFETFRT